LIFYYSRGKKTKIFAQALGEFLEQDVLELESDLNKRGKFSFFFKALRLAFSGKGYAVSNMESIKITAEEIFLCAPIWGGQIAAPVKYFLENADLKDKKVNLLLTASVPVEKYRLDALEFLRKFPCITGEAYIFATSGKVPPEKETIKEQLHEILPAST
jgi:hypothetical protein